MKVKFSIQHDIIMPVMINANNLNKAYMTLLKAYNDYNDNENSNLRVYIEDSIVKRFEYTLEASWKLLKKILIKEYGKSETELTINNIFRISEGLKYITDWEKWRSYYQLRNFTAHEYNIEKSKKIIPVVSSFLEDVHFLINAFEEKHSV